MQAESSYKAVKGAEKVGVTNKSLKLHFPLDHPSCNPLQPKVCRTAVCTQFSSVAVYCIVCCTFTLWPVLSACLCLYIVRERKRVHTWVGRGDVYARIALYY